MKKTLTDATEIKRIGTYWHEQLYANKLDNLKEMHKFLEKQNLARMNHEKIKKI